ncbi:hypothetical protein G6F40_016420 [Rhizopus arrhizus]|nr:hypothetical protein G6F40_016420 [Rhizopus arrhizus]
MARLGMQEDADPFDHPAVPEGHPLRRHVLYRVGQAQWRRQEKGDAESAHKANLRSVRVRVRLPASRPTPDAAASAAPVLVVRAFAAGILPAHF